jgi:hypothetical protein
VQTWLCQTARLVAKSELALRHCLHRCLRRCFRRWALCPAADTAWRRSTAEHRSRHHLGPWSGAEVILSHRPPVPCRRVQVEAGLDTQGADSNTAAAPAHLGTRPQPAAPDSANLRAATPKPAHWQTTAELRWLAGHHHSRRDHRALAPALPPAPRLTSYEPRLTYITTHGGTGPAGVV